MEIYRVNLRIKFEYEKTRTRKNSEFTHFSQNRIPPVFQQSDNHIGLIDIVRTQSFSRNYYFLPPDTHTYVYVSGGKKC